MPSYPNPDKLEEQSQYEPGIGSKLVNLATGGLFGALSGQTQKAQRGEMARQILLQENLRERELDRAMKRKVLEFAAQENLDPSQIQGTSGVEMMRSIYPVMEAKNLKRLKDTIKGITGQEPSSTASADELQGQLQKLKTTLTQDYGQNLRANVSGESLKALQGMGQFPSPMDVSKMTPAQKIAYEDVYGPKYRSSLISERQRQDEIDERNAFDAWNRISQDPKYVSQSGDVKDQVALNEEKRSELSKVYPNLNKAFKNDPSFKMQVGLMQEAKAGDLKTLRSRQDFYKQGNQLATAISDLVGDKDYSQISQMNFNELQAWRKRMGDKYFQQNPNMAKVDKVLQSFENLVMGKRKELFGVTLSPGEQESSNRSFGSPTQANFINSALNFMDSVFDPKFVQDNFTNLGVFVPPTYSDNLSLLNDEYQKIRSNIKSPSLSGEKTSKVTVTALPPDINAIGQQLQSMGNRINELESRNSTNIVNPLNK